MAEAPKIMYDAFISYSRATSSNHAFNLHALLRKRNLEVFFDREELAQGVEFPSRLAAGIRESRVFVALVDESYFCRWYCVQEFQIACRDLERAHRDPSGRPHSHVIVLGINRQPSPTVLDGLPPYLRTKNWPVSADSEGLARIVEDALANRTQSRNVSSDRAAGEEDTELASEAGIPQPLDVSGLAPRLFPQRFPPSLGRFFVGRAHELWDLHFNLVVRPRSVKDGVGATIVLEGGGGAGKSRLAMEYVHRYGPSHFPGGIYWLDASSSSMSFQLQLETLARDLPTRPGQDTSDPWKQLESWLSTSSLPPMLFVLDNIPERQPPLPLHRWCPAVGRQAVLVTSRQRVSIGERAAHAIQLNALPEDASLSLLTRDLSVTAANDVWRRIAAPLAGLPLALELLNRTLHLRVWAPETLARAMAQEGTLVAIEESHRVLAKQVPEGTFRGIVAAFEASLQKLPPTAVRLAEELAYLSPAPILSVVAEKLARSDDLAELVARSIVQPVTELEKPAYGAIHALLAEYLRHRPHKEPPFSRMARQFLNVVIGRRGLRQQKDGVTEALTQVFAEHQRDESILVPCSANLELLNAYLNASGKDVFAGNAGRNLLDAFIKSLVGESASDGPHQPRLTRLSEGVRRLDPNLSTALVDLVTLADRRLSLHAHPSVQGELAVDLIPFTAQPMVDEQWTAILSGASARFEETFRLRKEALGRSDLATLWSLHCTAFCCAATGDVSNAAKWYTELGTACEDHYGSRATQTVAARVAAMWALLLLGKTQVARKLRNKHLSWLEKGTNPAMDATVGHLGGVVMARLDLDDDDLATSVFKLTVELVESTNKERCNELSRQLHKTFPLK